MISNCFLYCAFQGSGGQGTRSSLYFGWIPLVAGPRMILRMDRTEVGWSSESRLWQFRMRTLNPGGSTNGEEDGELGVAWCLEISKTQLDIWVRISKLNHRQRKAPQLKAGGVSCLFPRDVLQGPSTAWVVVCLPCLGRLGDSSVFLSLISSESSPGIPDVFT